MLPEPRKPPVVHLTPKRLTNPRVAAASLRPQRVRWSIAGVAVLAVPIAVAVLASRDDAPDAPAAPPPPGEIVPVPPPPARTATSRTSAVDLPEPTVKASTKRRVRVTSIPSDATVLLDGQRLGRTPFQAELEVAPGPHVIKLRRRGYAPQKRTIEVAAGAGIDEVFRLAPVADN